MDFADKIYTEAVLLSRYDDQQLTAGAELAQKRYALLRTLLWMNVIKTQENCNKDFNSIIYLYDHDTKDLTKKAEQKVWSKILEDLKEDMGQDIILIPIAIDEKFTSLNSIIESYKIEKLPAIIVNGKPITNLLTKEEIKNRL